MYLYIIEFVIAAACLILFLVLLIRSRKTGKLSMRAKLLPLVIIFVFIPNLVNSSSVPIRFSNIEQFSESISSEPEMYAFFGENSCLLRQKTSNSSSTLYIYTLGNDGIYRRKLIFKPATSGIFESETYGSYIIYGGRNTDEYYILLTLSLNRDKAEIKDPWGNTLYSETTPRDIGDKTEYIYDICGYMGSSIENYSIYINGKEYKITDANGLPIKTS